VNSLAFTPEGKTLASGGLDRTVKLWDVRTGKEKATLRGHQEDVTSVAISPDGNTLASADHAGTIKLWDISSLTKAAR
jgi:WD40 repeat protein